MRGQRLTGSAELWGMKGKRLFTAEEEVEDTERAALLSGRGDLCRLPAATLRLLSLSNICRLAPRLPEYLVVFVSPGSLDGLIYCLCVKKGGGKDATALKQCLNKNEPNVL